MTFRTASGLFLGPITLNLDMIVSDNDDAQDLPLN